jgi:hypothetical protein
MSFERRKLSDQSRQSSGKFNLQAGEKSKLIAVSTLQIQLFQVIYTRNRDVALMGIFTGEVSPLPFRIQLCKKCNNE